MKHITLFTATTLTTLLAAMSVAAATVTTTGSGAWESTTPNAPWPGGTPPQATDDVVIDTGDTVTVDVPETCGSLEINSTGVCQNNSTLSINGNSGTHSGDLFGNGTLTQGVNATLNIAATGGTATTPADGLLGTLDADAAGNTVNYTGNAHFAKSQNYFNLTFSGYGNFYSGNVGLANDPANSPMTIGGNLTLFSTNTVLPTAVQLANAMTINGNMTIGATCKFDPSLATFSVASNLYVGGTLTDGDGAPAGGMDIISNLVVLPTGTWAMSDVPPGVPGGAEGWTVSGNVTNEGTMTGIAYGGINFAGTSILAGPNGVTIPQMIVSDTIVVDTTLTVITNLELNGTLIFDINTAAPSNTLVYLNGDITFGGNLIVNNVGATLTAGDTFQLFSAAGYGGFPGFNSTSYPPLGYGLQWVDNTASDGTIQVIGLYPALVASQSAGQLTLSWDTADYPGYSLQAQTNAPGIGTNWVSVAGGSSSPFTVAVNPTNKAVFFRLVGP